MQITESQLVLADRIREACRDTGLILMKEKTILPNLGMTPYLALAVALYPAPLGRTREGPDNG